MVADATKLTATTKFIAGPAAATHKVAQREVKLAGLVGTGANLIVMGDEIWIYYGGWDQVHEDYEGIDCAIGLAKLRLDGFCSMQGGVDEGWFISRREVFNIPSASNVKHLFLLFVLI